MDLTTNTPVVLVKSGYYERDGQTMTRRDGSPVAYVEVISTTAQPGDPVVSLPCGEGVDLKEVPIGSHLSLGLHLRTEMVSRQGRNGSAYVAAQIKQRVTRFQLVKANATPAAA